MAALRLATDLEENPRSVTHADRDTLSQWASWGAVPEVFDPGKPQWRDARDELRALVGERGFNAAARTTINAHYTHPQLVEVPQPWLGDQTESVHWALGVVLGQP